ncbi:DUF3011 domain-containing protein [Uliginosibacterium paludis]|uniref:DUF3011 domain-containing protein n=1 Tax=Uliginosibacterium paludis TaxID=1615952 RepID=A0ABV2CME9_9RHOO
MSRYTTRILVSTLAFTLAAAPFQGAFAAEQTISCNSRGHDYTYCQVDTANHVELVKKNSWSDCEQGRSWGYDEHGVWVDRGCSADFRVGQEDQHKNNHPRTKAIAIGAAVLGAAALGAMLLSKHSQDQSGNESTQTLALPEGSFSGYDRMERTPVDFTVDGTGHVRGHAGSRSFEGQVTTDSLQLGRHSFSISPNGNGFEAADLQNPAHHVSFSPARGGYAD